jgi:hypothetical protein
MNDKERLEKTEKFAKYGAAVDVKEVSGKVLKALKTVADCIEYIKDEEMGKAFVAASASVTALLGHADRYIGENKPPEDEIRDLEGFRDRGISSWMKPRGGGCGSCPSDGGCGGSCSP